MDRWFGLSDMEFIVGLMIVICTILLINFFRFRERKKKLKSKSALIKRIKERGEVDSKLREKLISMLAGDVEEAERLVARKRFGKEGKYSENYCWWLAIRDVEQRNGDK
ncbi:hypothetical protein [Leptolyngbya ohadii]|uniref:hypothetical protein n=1 Tax=Leptolyngbya ohadii TaxID=1962290 RepID=UPI0019D45F42|nr:hypothetical protein [Leptolyngbya ohadii]